MSQSPSYNSASNENAVDHVASPQLEQMDAIDNLDLGFSSPVASHHESQDVSPLDLLMESQSGLAREVARLTRLITSASSGQGEEFEQLQKLWEQKSSSLLRLNSLIKDFKTASAPASVPFRDQDMTLPVPDHLPLFQWKGVVYDSSRVVFDNVQACIRQFEDRISCVGLSIEKHWFRLVVPNLMGDQRRWCDVYTGKATSPVSWVMFKTALINKYSGNSGNDVLKANSELMALQHEPNESMDDFVDRFNALKTRAKIHISHVLVTYFRAALSEDFLHKLTCTMGTATPEQLLDIEFNIKVAKNIYNMLQDATQSAALKRSSPSSSSSSSGSSSSGSGKKAKFSSGPSGTTASKYASPSSSSASSSSSVSSPGVYCSYHRVKTHSTEKCKAIRNGADKPKPGPTDCRRCGAKNWTPAHLAVCPAGASSSGGPLVHRSMNQSVVPSQDSDSTTTTTTLTSVPSQDSQISFVPSQDRSSSFVPVQDSASRVPSQDSESSSPSVAAAATTVPSQDEVVSSVEHMELDSDEESLLVAAQAQQ